MKYAAVVILYNPEVSAVKNIESYSSHFGKIYVFDNTEQVTNIKEDISKLSKVEYYHDGENKGISERLNTGCRKAITDGFQWIIAMDQDSKFHPETIVNYLNCFQNFYNKEKVAAFGTRYSRLQEAPNPVCSPEQVLDVITSGSLYNLVIWQELGGFDEALFIDSVDQEYSIRAGMAGYENIQFTNVHLQHEIGTEVYRGSIKSLFLIRKHKIIHSPLRCYYMYRNMLYIEDKYKNTNPEFSKIIRKNVETHMKVCRYYGRETEKLNRYIEIAKKDFHNKNMGKISKKSLLKD